VSAQSVLEIRGLTVNYGAIQALKDVTITVHAGEVVTLIGANGAGKSTTLRAVSRLLNPRSGTIQYQGKDIARLRADEVVRAGIAHVPRGSRMCRRVGGCWPA